MADFFTIPASALPRPDRPSSSDLTAQMRMQIQDIINSQKALKVPAYMVADLPDATKYTDMVIRVIDNPQGTAVSNGTSWVSDVDGTNLGGGNG